MNPWMRNLLCGGGGGGPVLPSAGRTMLAKLTSSLILDEGTGGPTWSRATKAWAFNELGYLEELASGCAFFGGARLVRNLVPTPSNTLAIAGTKTVTLTKAATLQFSMGAGAGTATFSGTGGASGTLAAGANRVSVNKTVTAGTFIVTASVDALVDLSVVDVTNYDAAYVPEYVSVGVEASPHFGAGIDGAKYFETDWQGAPIAAANLLGFRREAAAINNLLHSRDLTQSAWTQTGTSGSEIVTNGVFAADTDWTKGTGWSISAGVATRTDVAAISNLAQSISISAGTAYVISYGVTVSSGNIKATFGGGATANGIARTATGTYSEVLIANSGNYELRFSASSTFAGTIDNISIKVAAVQPTKTATGLDGLANTATTLTATAADAIILQPTSGIASAARCASSYVKRRTGTGTISFTQDGGSTWTDITSQINSSTWSRVQITSTLANPSVGFKISTSGDAIDVDCVQNEAGAVATSPIVTTTATITRNADSLTYQTAGNIDTALGTLFCEYSVYEETMAAPRAVIGLSTTAATANALLLHATGVATSSLSSGDGTTLFAKTGLGSAVNTKRKAAVSWGAGRSLTAEGLAPQAGAFSGTLPSAAIAPGAYTNGTFPINGYIGPVAIYNYQMTDAELQAITT